MPGAIVALAAFVGAFLFAVAVRAIRRRGVHFPVTWYDEFRGARPIQAPPPPDDRPPSR